MKIIFSILSVILIFLLVINMDIDRNTYNTMKEVLEDKATNRGWIPAIIPVSSYDITEVHNIDTNQIDGSFYYHEKDKMSFLDNFSEDNLTWNGFIFTIDRDNNFVRFKSL